MKYNSLRLKGKAKWMAFPENLDHLKELREHLLKTGEGFSFLGKGSNLLIPDTGFSAWIIRTSSLLKSMKIKDSFLHVSAASLNARVIRFCAEKAFSGLEFLTGVPGSIGGAVSMNAGSFQSSIQDCIEEVRSFCFKDAVEKIYTKKDLRFSYRQQNFMSNTELILHACFRLQKTSSQEVEEKMKKARMERKEAQPLELPSFGSVFRNPEGKKAWQLIEKVGLRGKRKGGAQISEKHSNFIVNHGGARTEDVLYLIRLAQEEVYKQEGVCLEEEVRFLKAIHIN